MKYLVCHDPGTKKFWVVLFLTTEHSLIFPFLTSQLPYVSIDFDRWEVWSSSEEDEEDEGTRAAPATPSNSRRESEDKEESKRVLLPEMLVSESSNSEDEESFPSDVDCFNFNWRSDKLASFALLANSGKPLKMQRKKTW